MSMKCVRRIIHGIDEGESRDWKWNDRMKERKKMKQKKKEWNERKKNETKEKNKYYQASYLIVWSMFVVRENNKKWICLKDEWTSKRNNKQDNRIQGKE